MKTQITTATKSSKFDPASADRPDFGLFEHLLGRSIKRPATAKQAHRKIRSLLAETYATRPLDLVECVAANRINGHLKAMGVRDTGAARSQVVRNVASRLWCDNAQGRYNRNRNPSANIIKHFCPERHGVVQYLRCQIGYVLIHLAREEFPKLQTVSLDALTEGGFDPAEPTFDLAA